MFQCVVKSFYYLWNGLKQLLNILLFLLILYPIFATFGGKFAIKKVFIQQKYISKTDITSIYSCFSSTKMCPLQQSIFTLLSFYILDQTNWSYKKNGSQSLAVHYAFILNGSRPTCFPIYINPDLHLSRPPILT